MKTTELPNGLVIPQSCEKDTREYGPLELTYPYDRISAGECFKILKNLSEVRCRLDKPGNAMVRDMLITQLAHMLLGDDWDCEIPC